MSDKLPCNMLRAEELLRSKGIRSCVLEECEKSLYTLPTKGKKYFEPNNSRLQNVQIEKGLKTRRDLLNIERVNRASELAIAEWIPSQKKAVVTKRSGQDWNNFGLEKNGSLYLIPEEALFLLEANCIELIWNGVPCSIQQAYGILIDDSICTLDEYRVYSQLIHHGYRIQRYHYEDSEKCGRAEDSTTTKRKVIVDPENGLRMCDSQTHNKLQQQTTEISKKNLAKDISKTLGESLVSSNRRNCQNTVVEKDMEQAVHDVLDKLLCSVENEVALNCSANTGMVESNKRQKNGMSSEEKSRNSKVEIISDETLLGNIRILDDTTCNSKKEVSTSKWPGARIQRNVKLLPKRTDKISLSEISIIGCVDERTRCVEKRKATAQNDESLVDAKRSKHEVIELSDDEIQELPRPMTRMEMLNLLPNIASQSVVTEIPRQYIPCNVKPQKSTYQYNKTKILRMHENDNRARQDCKGIRTNARQNAFHSNAVASRSPVNIGNRNVFQNQQGRLPLCNIPRPFYAVDQMQGTNIGFPYAYNNRFPFSYGQAAYALQNRVTLMQQNVFQNMIVAFENHENAIQHSRSVTIHMNNFAMPLLGGYRMRPHFIENQCRSDFHQNFLWYQRFWQRRAMENASLMHGNAPYSGRRRYDDASRADNQSIHEVVNRPSFTTRSGASSWTELKKKWCEEKTITIDDEDNKNRNENGEECNEVQILEQCINPLVGPRNASLLIEDFSKLAIIKPAPEKMVRRKKNRYKISYNVYSCNHHYRKANPGQPLCCLVVIRKENSLLQPVELNRLQQDAKGSKIILAYVSMSISYIGPGLIMLPNMT